MIEINSDAQPICTEMYQEIDWITDFEPANSGQLGLTLQFQLKRQTWLARICRLSAG